MAQLEFEDTVIDVPENVSLADYVEQFGFSIGCRVGVCGSCRIKVLEGMDNLNERTDMELSFALGEGERLACQCRILSGMVRITKPES